MVIKRILSSCWEISPVCCGLVDCWFAFCLRRVGCDVSTCWFEVLISPLTPNNLYMSRTAPLTSKHCILYIYSTNVGTEYVKHALYSPLFSLQNAVCFIMLTCLVPVLFIFYIQSVMKLKKIIPAPKG